MRLLQRRGSPTSREAGSVLGGASRNGMAARWPVSKRFSSSLIADDPQCFGPYAWPKEKPESVVRAIVALLVALAAIVAVGLLAIIASGA